jgi:hypothetical protein
MYGKECVMNVEKNKNKENLNLTIRPRGKISTQKMDKSTTDRWSKIIFQPSPYFKWALFAAIGR